MLSRVAMLFAFVAAAGCSKTDRLPTYPVTGKIVFADGKPLPGGWVVCLSIDHGLAARGVVDEEGAFTLGTYELDDGAVAGPASVAITAARPEGIDPDRQRPRPVLHPRFSRPESSGLEIDVEPGAKNYFELTVARP